MFNGDGKILHVLGCLPRYFYNYFSEKKIDQIENNSLYYSPGRILNRPEEITVETEDEMNKIKTSMKLRLHPNDVSEYNLSNSSRITLEDENGNEIITSEFIADGEIEGIITSTDYFGRMVTDLESSNNPDFSSSVPILECKKITIKK